MKKLLKFWDHYSDYIWRLPLWALVVYFLFFLIPALDPTAGMDGLADVFNFVLVLAELQAVFAVSWSLQKLYWRVIGKTEEEDLWVKTESQDETVRKTAWRKLLWDRAQFVALVVIQLTFLLLR